MLLFSSELAKASTPNALHLATLKKIFQHYISDPLFLLSLTNTKGKSQLKGSLKGIQKAFLVTHGNVI